MLIIYNAVENYQMKGRKEKRSIYNSKVKGWETKNKTDSLENMCEHKHEIWTRLQSELTTVKLMIARTKRYTVLIFRGKGNILESVWSKWHVHYHKNLPATISSTIEYPLSNNTQTEWIEQMPSENGELLTNLPSTAMG